MAKPKLRDVPDLTDLAISGREIPVRVTPKASRDSVIRDGDTLRITVTAPPDNGKANTAVQWILATALGIATSRLILKRGQTSRDKTFVVRD